MVPSTLGIAVRFHQMPRTHLPPQMDAATKRSRTIVRQHPMQHEEPSCSSAFSRSAVPLPLHLQNWSSNVVQIEIEIATIPTRDGRPSLVDCHVLLRARRQANPSQAAGWRKAPALLRCCEGREGGVKVSISVRNAFLTSR